LEITRGLRANPQVAASINPPHANHCKTWQTNAMDTSPLIIAGGGIAGLAAALALGERDAEIYEQAPAFTQTGAGIQIGPNAVRALQKLGAWDAVEPCTLRPKTIHFKDGLTGQSLTQIPLGDMFSSRFGAHYHVAHRAGLHAGLLSVVRSKPNLALHLGHSLEHFESGTHDVQLRLKNQSRRTPALIIADGIQSRLRQSVLPQQQALSAGVTFHRALLPLNNFPTDVTVWMLPRGHVVHYAVGNPAQLNIIAITPVGESWAEFFQPATPPLLEIIEHAQEHFTPWPALYVQPLQKWTIGHALLLGDAAHGTLPYMAQGAAMALEDAACLKQALSSAPSLRDAFAETAARRIPRTKRLHVETVKTGKIYHAKEPLRTLRNLAFKKMPLALLLRRLDWLYQH
jgi:salicylate hydroxylase